jgi:Spy/CpxP family protein refolding chaperone
MLPKPLFMSTSSLLILSAIVAALFLGLPAWAQECRHTIDWKQLNLTPQQAQQIHVLEQDWHTKYMRLQPQILDHQRRLALLFSDPKSDQLEIITLQQSIARLQEQLRNEATANYLHKRVLLDEQQQHMLELQLQQLIANRQRAAAPTAQTSDQSGGFMDLIHKIRWAIEQH